jgi:hypothetical protein
MEVLASKKRACGTFYPAPQKGTPPHVKQVSTSRNDGSRVTRLAETKKKYDPSNVLRLNQNIKPA